jgi:hypothetical protein
MAKLNSRPTTSPPANTIVVKMAVFLCVSLRAQKSQKAASARLKTHYGSQDVREVHT